MLLYWKGLDAKSSMRKGFLWYGKIHEWRKSLFIYDFASDSFYLSLFDNAFKVHKNENVFGFDFEFCTISLLVMHKEEDFGEKTFWLDHYGGSYDYSA